MTGRVLFYVVCSMLCVGNCNAIYVLLVLACEKIKQWFDKEELNSLSLSPSLSLPLSDFLLLFPS